MMILKIMSNQDLADADPSKEFLLVANVVRVRFYTDEATTFEKSEMNYEKDAPEPLMVSFAHAVIADFSPDGLHDERHLLTGNCYVLNDRGKTIESFWARKNAHGEQVGEA